MIIFAKAIADIKLGDAVAIITDEQGHFLARAATGEDFKEASPNKMTLEEAYQQGIAVL